MKFHTKGSGIEGGKVRVLMSNIEGMYSVYCIKKARTKRFHEPRTQNPEL